MSAVDGSGALAAAPVGPVQWWRYLYRLPLLALVIVPGVPLTLACFLPGLRKLPAGNARLFEQGHRLWSRAFLAVFGIRLEVYGSLPAPPYLLVANHISWIDIVLLHAVLPVRLVAKSEIRDWPVIGWLAMVAGTLFITRGAEDSRRRAGRRMAARLRRGAAVGVFPEGGISGHRGVGRFHARLFSAAIRAPAPVVPVAIRYDRAGDLHEERVFARGENFVVNLFRLLGHPPCRGIVRIGPPLTAVAGERSRLARQAQSTVTELYERPSSA